MPRRDYERDDDTPRRNSARPVAGLQLLVMIVWAVAAVITLITGLVWLLMMRASDTVFQQCAASASAAAVLIGVYIVVRAADRVLHTIIAMRVAP